ncbi:uncharacterized protein sano [Eurosta solidaginis]|uniref:uncharacterized protein sano n=1 Tax=Eurosta solidaginis TaxID=178769 RepID=UPI0035305D2D
MAATDGQIILAASRFGDTEPPVYLREFSKQKLPAVAKIIKGQHQNLGVPTLSAPSLQSTALFLSAGKKYQILAQPIKIKEGRKTTNVGAKVLIPETYVGYFELLSEDGRSTRCIDSVLELSKRRNLRVLVRETFRCTQMNRTIHAGEMLTTMNDNGKYLQCKNIKDEIINLPLDTKAKFSPIAKEDSISGVHTVKNLLLKRMPVIVRLVHGSAPKGLKQPFVPELRLLGCVEIDRIFALPLQKDNDLVPVPLNVKIKLQRARNMEQLEHFIEYTRFLEKAQRLLSDARDRLQIVDLKLSEKEKKDSKFSSRNKLPIVMLPSAGLMESGYVLRKSASCDAYGKGSGGAAGVLTSAEIAEEYNEIDHIYDYVRGLTPLSKGLTRFEPICETPTIKSHHTDSSGNYCSLIRVGAQASTSNSNNNSNSLNNNSANNINHSGGGVSGGGGGGGSGNIVNNNNNYSSLESVKQANTNTNSSHNSSNHSHNNSNNHNTGGSGGSGGGASHHHHHHHQSHSHNHHLNQAHQHPHLHPHAHPSSHQAYHSSVGGGTVVNHYHHSHVQEDIKPVPPPIETIPGKKLPEKRQRPTLPKLYLKNTHSTGSNSASGATAAAALSTSATSNHHHHHHHHSTQTAIVVNATAAAVAAHHAHHHHDKVLTPNNNNNNNNGGHTANGPLSAGILGTNKECSNLEPQSPLFHIRYKSLSSLQLTPENSPIATTPISNNSKGNQTTAVPPDVVLKCNSILNHQTHRAPHLPPPPPPPLSKSTSATGGLAAVTSMGMGVGVVHHNPREGTLDSSRSGGRTSGDSNKLPEKKTRRLSRPRSLSNLVWDLRPSKEKSKKKLYIHHFDHRQQATLYL